MTNAAPHPVAEEFGAFLRSRRARIAPADAGIADTGRRRVQGLRREELAHLAGVSITYLTRLEQGRATSASDAIVEALARALRLSADDRAHLFALARAGQRRARSVPETEVPDPGAVQLLHAMRDVPALLLGRRLDILDWNRAGHALFAHHLDWDAPHGTPRPNQLRMLFCDPATRALHRDWESEAAAAVASLRYVTGHFPDDAGFGALITELRSASADFRRLWEGFEVRLCATGTKPLHHPVVGDLDLQFEMLHLPESGGQRILTHTAEPGSASEAAIRSLIS